MFGDVGLTTTKEPYASPLNNGEHLPYMGICQKKCQNWEIVVLASLLAVRYRLGAYHGRLYISKGRSNGVFQYTRITALYNTRRCNFPGCTK